MSAVDDAVALAHQRSAPSAFAIVVVGGLCMATAMGIGRFAFTPLLPLMQSFQGLQLADGAWLAVVNYLGYLVGAIGGFIRPPRPGASTRWGVALVAVSTLGMSVTSAMPLWLVLRFVAGIASALVMMGIAGWALAQLATLGRGKLGGLVFGCVGLSIAIVGAVVYGIATTVGDPRGAWAILGIASTLIAVGTWRRLSREPTVHAMLATAAPPLDRESWLLIVCYSVAGFGYIVPATFLPAVARALVDDPAVFGWIWPAFGIAAAVGTVGTSTLLAKVPPRTICAGGMLVMAIGTATPVIHMSIAALIVSAICVGGTFIVVTLAGLQEARRIAHVAPARAVAGMTASFALGQLVGPLLAHAGSSAIETMRLPSIVATVGLVVGAAVLVGRRSASPAIGVGDRRR